MVQSSNPLKNAKFKVPNGLVKDGTEWVPNFQSCWAVPQLTPEKRFWLEHFSNIHGKGCRLGIRSPPEIHMVQASDAVQAFVPAGALDMAPSSMWCMPSYIGCRPAFAYGPGIHSSSSV